MTSVPSAEHNAADQYNSSSSVVQEKPSEIGHCIPDAVYCVPSKGERMLPLIPWFTFLLVSLGMLLAFTPAKTHWLLTSGRLRSPASQYPAPITSGG